MNYEIQNGEYSISTDPEKIDVSYVHNFLTNSYWAEGIGKNVVKKSIEGSLCFGVYKGEQQIGFARMVTDRATFAYLADVFIDTKFRGSGLSKWLIETILKHPDMKGLRRIMLATKDAHGLYEKFGFTGLTKPERWMQINPPDIYKNK